MKAVIFVCDGAADRPLRELGGRTPLEAAKTPNLDRLAGRGICGQVDQIGPGVRIGSDTAHLAILGYDPYRYYSGRGPIEAAGIGMEVRPTDIALRCNFATVGEKRVVKDRRAGRVTDGKKELAEAINGIKIGGCEILFMNSTGHRGVLRLRDSDLSEKVTDSDPHFEGKKVAEVKALDEGSEKTARVLNELTKKLYEVLNGHEVNRKRVKEGKPPANMLLMRSAGRGTTIPTFEEKYGLKGACIANVGLIRGVGRFCGLDVIDLKGRDMGELAREVLERYDFLLMNLKDPDNAAHDRDAKQKVSAIERADGIAARFKDFIDKNYLAVLSDHTTSTSFGDHTGDPVPIMICGPEVRTDRVKEFGERAVTKGGLGRIKGQDIMPLLIDLMNRSEKFGS